MLKPFRRKIIHKLWIAYRNSTLQMQQMEKGLKEKNLDEVILDHFAIIDLPGPHSGIPLLKALFSLLGFIERGKDYLADKQNDFLWMAESDSLDAPAKDVLPQVVVADFRLEEMPPTIARIILKYSSQASKLSLPRLQTLKERMLNQDSAAEIELENIILNYLKGRDWSLPSIKEFREVQAFNELLAWVLVFGRRPNHFTLSIHLLNHFSNLNDFHYFVEKELNMLLNQDGGKIKGGKHYGIAQGSTQGISETVQLEDGIIQIPTGFIEFVWRFANKNPSIKWQDYFTGFIAQHADHVIESLYLH